MEYRHLRQLLSLPFVSPKLIAQSRDQAKEAPSASDACWAAADDMKIDPRVLRWMSSPGLQPPK